MKDEKVKEHIKNVPIYNFKSGLRHLKYKTANWLMGDVLNKTIIWYNELCELMDVDVEEQNRGLRQDETEMRE